MKKIYIIKNTITDKILMAFDCFEDAKKYYELFIPYHSELQGDYYDVVEVEKTDNLNEYETKKKAEAIENLKKVISYLKKEIIKIKNGETKVRIILSDGFTLNNVSMYDFEDILKHGNYREYGAFITKLSNEFVPNYRQVRKTDLPKIDEEYKKFKENLITLKKRLYNCEREYIKLKCILKQDDDLVK